MNLLLAVLIFSAVAFAIGTPSTLIADIGAGSPAEAAGILPGDRIVAVGDKPVTEWDEIKPAIIAATGDHIAITVLRGEHELRLESGFYTDDEGDRIIGITAGMERLTRNIGPALLLGCRATWSMGVAMVQAIGMLFTGGVTVEELQPVGPFGIVNIIGDVAKNGMLQLAQLTALISLNLGIVNLLPIPALDGCRFIFLFIRKITGKAVTDEMEGRVHFVGIMLLFALMIFVTFQDVTRFVL
jgi:regulator of sigma E protease